MPNGDDSQIWQAIEESRRGLSQVRTDQAVISSQFQALQEANARTNRKIDESESRILDEIKEQNDTLHVRFNKQRAAIAATIIVAVPTITALGTALLSR